MVGVSNSFLFTNDIEHICKAEKGETILIGMPWTSVLNCLIGFIRFST